MSDLKEKDFRAIKTGTDLAIYGMFVMSALAISSSYVLGHWDKSTITENLSNIAFSIGADGSVIGLLSMVLISTWGDREKNFHQKYGNY